MEDSENISTQFFATKFTKLIHNDPKERMNYDHQAPDTP
jgi:hypothetical protein